MKKADDILEDEGLIDAVYKALRRRRPLSGTRGRKGTQMPKGFNQVVKRIVLVTDNAQR